MFSGVLNDIRRSLVRVNSRFLIIDKIYKIFSFLMYIHQLLKRVKYVEVADIRRFDYQSKMSDQDNREYQKCS